ncbi:MAG TPA: carbohydrate kinase family protein [Candidatus Bathyarchaeia archaeon]|nr:carbohydrate kinase family protein [Candidatus Bathyarchaeia archaeon]
MNYDVISFGSATLDVFIKSKDFQVLGTNKVFTGQALIVPYGAKCEVDQLMVQSGGGGTNTAVGFSRLGLKAAIVARCGWDFAGKIIRKELIKERVDDSLLVKVNKEEATDYSTILIGPDGDRTILVYRGKTRLEWKIIDFRRLESRWFYISSLEGNLSLLKELLNFAHRHKIKVAVNPGRKELNQKELLLPLFSEIDVVILNREEAALLTGLTIDDKKTFPAIAASVKELAVITDSSRGLSLYTGKKRQLTSDSFKVDMVESTGPGDAFGCGFVAGLAMDWKLEDCLKLGSANGASVVSHIGAKTGLLSRNEAAKWMNKPLTIKWTG